MFTRLPYWTTALLALVGLTLTPATLPAQQQAPTGPDDTPGFAMRLQGAVNGVIRGSASLYLPTEDLMGEGFYMIRLRSRSTENIGHCVAGLYQPHHEGRPTPGTYTVTSLEEAEGTNFVGLLTCQQRDRQAFFRSLPDGELQILQRNDDMLEARFNFTASFPPSQLQQMPDSLSSRVALQGGFRTRAVRTPNSAAQTGNVGQPLDNPISDPRDTSRTARTDPNAPDSTTEPSEPTRDSAVDADTTPTSQQDTAGAEQP